MHNDRLHSRTIGRQRQTVNACEEAKRTQFWKIDGCINCFAYQDHLAGKLQLHEAMASCLLRGCMDFGHSILKPFIGTHEIVKHWKRHPEQRDTLRKRIYHILESRDLNPEEVLR